MNQSSEVKVGAVVIIALLALIGVGYYILGPGRIGRTYQFEIQFADAQGLTGGEPVRMAGVQIGEVKDVTLSMNRKADVTVRIQRGIRLYRGTSFTISSAALMPERFINVEPVSATEANNEQIKPGEMVQGIEQPGLQQIIVSAQKLLSTLQVTATSINTIVGDPAVLKATRESLLNFETTTRNTAAMTENLARLTSETRPAVAQAVRDLATAGEDARKTAEFVSLRLRTSRAPADVEAAVAAIRKAAEEAKQTAASLHAMLDQPNMKEDVGISVENLRKMSENLRDATANVRDITGDLKTSTPQLKNVIGNADVLLSDASALKERLKPPQVKPDFSFRFSPHARRSFTDANFDISFAGDKQRFTRLGVSDIGEENQVNLQMGLHRNKYDLRYGLVRSKLGLGVDYPISPRTSFSVDALNPNRLRLDLTGEYNLTDPDTGWGLIFGIRDAFGDNFAFLGARMGK
jgi:phospholipid/cholesterol/gamma-HCH transport system substrate-binding protein